LLEYFSAKSHSFLFFLFFLINSACPLEKEVQPLEEQAPVKTKIVVSGPRNWLKSSTLINQALDTQENIISAHKIILESHKDNYQPKTQTVGKILSAFYANLGSQGEELAKTIAEVTLEIEQKLIELSEKIKHTNVDDKATRFVIYELEEKINDNKEQLEALNNKASNLLAMKKRFEERSKIVDDGVTQATEILNSTDDIVNQMYEEQSYEEIEKNFVKVDHALKKMTAIKDYLNLEALEPFKAEFDNFEEEIKKLEKKIKSINNELDSLVTTLETEGRFSFNKPEEKEQSPTIKSTHRPQSGLFSKVINFFTDAWSFLTS
jgi:chromosome segregation ATPase